MFEPELMEKPRLLKGSLLNKFLKVIFITLAVLLVLAVSLPPVWKHFSESKEAEHPAKRPRHFVSARYPLERRGYLSANPDEVEAEEQIEESSDHERTKPNPVDLDASRKLITALLDVKDVTDEADPQLQMIDSTIEAGAKPNLIFPFHESAMMCAASHWILPGLKRMGPIDFEAKFKGATVMHFVAHNVPISEEGMRRARATVDYLIEAGGDVNVGWETMTPLNYALNRGNARMADILIERGAAFNTE